MPNITVNGQIGTVSIKQGEQYTVRFEGYNNGRSLYDINQFPDLLLYEGKETTITLTAPSVRGTMILRAYDYCTFGACFYPSNDIIINIISSSVDATSSCPQGKSIPLEVDTWGNATCPTGYTPDIIEPANLLLFRPPYGACICDALSDAEKATLHAGGYEQFKEEKGTDWVKTVITVAVILGAAYVASSYLGGKK